MKQPNFRASDLRRVRALQTYLSREQDRARCELEAHTVETLTERPKSLFASKFGISVEAAVDTMIDRYGLAGVAPHVNCEFSERLAQWWHWFEWAGEATSVALDLAAPPKPLTKQRYMMATTAIHKLGDISSDSPDLCIVHSQDDENFYGNWVTGFGFVNVRFPKSTTRELTPEEVKHYNEVWVQLSDHEPQRLNIPAPQ